MNNDQLLSQTELLALQDIPHKLDRIEQTLRLLTRDDEIMTVKEVAGFLKLSIPTIYRLSNQGVIKGHKIGGTANGVLRFKKSELLTKQRNSLISIL